MFYFTLAWTIGIVLRYLFIWAFAPKGTFTIKANIAQFIVAFTVGLGISWLCKSINFSGWLPFAFIAVLGFLSKYGLEWLNKKKG